MDKYCGANFSSRSRHIKLLLLLLMFGNQQRERNTTLDNMNHTHENNYGFLVRYISGAKWASANIAHDARSIVEALAQSNKMLVYFFFSVDLWCQEIIVFFSLSFSLSCCLACFVSIYKNCIYVYSDGMVCLSHLPSDSLYFSLVVTLSLAHPGHFVRIRVCEMLRIKAAIITNDWWFAEGKLFSKLLLI